MKLSSRQEDIVRIVREKGPIRGQDIADYLDLTRSALRADLSVLTMLGILDAKQKVGYLYVGDDHRPVSDKMTQYLVEDVMASPVSVAPATNVYDTIVSMFTEDVGTMLVCEDGVLLGVVSRKDLLRATIGQIDPVTVPISMIMTPVSKLIYAQPKETVLEAVEKLLDYEVDCLPVVTVDQEEGKRVLHVVGRFSKTNITQIFFDIGSKKGA